MTLVLPDPETPFGERVRKRLAEERVIWFTSVSNDGTPQPNPIWFLWEPDDRILVYTKTDAVRLQHIEKRPNVALHMNTSATGGDIVVFRGVAKIDADEPAPPDNQAYLAKYGDALARAGTSPEKFAETYPVPVVVDLDGLRGF